MNRMRQRLVAHLKNVDGPAILKPEHEARKP